MARPLILIANPGSASRKYALFEGETERAKLHFEWGEQQMVCTLYRGDHQKEVPVSIPNLETVPEQLISILHAQHLLQENEHITHIGLRVVAPGAYFLQNRQVNDEFITHLEAAAARAPLHVTATLHELHGLRKQLDQTVIIGISDSAFHSTKPDYAWNYGLPLADADRLDIKRFGYHGLSVASVVRTLQQANKLPPKLIVCHIGSGVSVTAVQDGKSVDTTMGYSPLEGVIMSTRSGSIDLAAADALKQSLGFSDVQLESYLNQQSGLLGLGGSADLRELLRREAAGNHQAHLAIQTYIFNLQKAIGQMAAALGGLDALVFTGTAGERSAPIRQRVVERLHYLDLSIDIPANLKEHTSAITTLSRPAHTKPIYIVSADESREIMHAVKPEHSFTSVS